MSTTPQHREVRRYLDDLRDATDGLPRARRRELLTEIEEHLAEAAPPGASDAQVREALDRLGDPEQIAAAEAGPDVASPRALAWTDRIVIPVLLVGALVTAPFGGLLLAGATWFAGVLLLWFSRVFTVRDKLLGTLVVPGGLLPAAFLVLAGVSVESCSTSSGGVQHCTGGMSAVSRAALIALWVALLVAPIVTATVLGRRLRG
jgi:hypothetical protein